MKLSIVATLYQSVPYISAFYERISAAAQKLVGDEYEIILVNDGSPDNSLELVVQFAEHDPRLVVVDLSRNFGHHKAMMAGLSYAKGGRVFLIDSDLEEDPEWLESFAEQMERESCDVIYGVQEQRKGKWFERISGQCFHRLFKIVTRFEMPENMVTARLMSRRYLDSLLLHKERDVFIPGLWYITGFEQHGQFIKKHSTSETTYTFRKKMSHVVNAMTAFTNAPLVGIFYIGFAIAACSLCYALYLIVNWMFFSKPLTGWTSVIASIWLLGGMIISFIGILGIYLSKVFLEIKQRPNTIVKQVYEQCHWKD